LFIREEAAARIPTEAVLLADLKAVELRDCKTGDNRDANPKYQA
jgi:hypothetical protein